MKKLKILLPALAFLFAIAAAFASDRNKSEGQVEYTRKVNEVCLTCAPNSINEPAVCDETPSKTMCFCDTGTSAIDQLHEVDPQGEDCTALWRND